MIRKNFIYKLHSFLLTVILILQSCTIYHKQNYTPDEVVASQKKLRLTRINGEQYPFYKLIKEDGDYYVLAKESIFFKNKFKERDTVKLGYPGFSAYKIEVGDYKALQIKNTSGSAIATAAIFVVISIAILWITLKSEFDDGIFSDLN